MAESPLSRSHAVCWGATLVRVILRTRCRGRRPHWAFGSVATPRGFPTEGGRRDCSSTELRLGRFLPPGCALLESTLWACELPRTLRGLDGNIPRCRRSAHCSCMRFQSSFHTQRGVTEGNRKWSLTSPTDESFSAHLATGQCDNLFIRQRSLSRCQFGDQSTTVLRPGPCPVIVGEEARVCFQNRGHRYSHFRADSGCMRVIQDAHLAAENFLQCTFQMMSWVQTVGQVRHKKLDDMRQDRNARHDGYVRNPARSECPFRQRFEKIRTIVHRPSTDEQCEDDKAA